MASGLALVAFVCLIVVPYLLRTRDRSFQKRTRDLATIRCSLDDYAAEHGVYPVADSIEQLKDRLVRKDGSPIPIHDPWNRAAKLPMLDPWGRPWIIHVTPLHYTLRTLGADGKLDPDPPRGGLLSTESPDRDTIIVDGRALQHPWNFGGGGDEGGSGSIVSLGAGRDAGEIIFDAPINVMQGGRLVASLPEASSRFEAPAGEYQLRIRSDGPYRFESVTIESGKILFNPPGVPWSGRPELPDLEAKPRRFSSTGGGNEGVHFVLLPRGRSSYDYPAFVLRGNGWREELEPSDAVIGFGVPAGQYELSVRLTNQVRTLGTFKAEHGKWTYYDIPVSWGDVHVSLDGPVEIHEATVAGWSAVVRMGAQIVARTEYFPDVFFLTPGRYALDLLHDGHVRSTRQLQVGAASEQWIALKE